MQLNKGVKALSLSTILLSCFFVASSAYADGKIYISQVQTTGGTGKTAWDFVEIFNPNDTPFNLKGYRLVKRTASGSTDTTLKSWSSDVVIPAKSFYLWANADYTAITPTPDVATSGTISDNNGVALRQGEENSGGIVDSLAWGTAANGFTNVIGANPSANLAVARQDVFNDISNFVIAASQPRNSSVSLGAAITPPLEEQATSTLQNDSLQSSTATKDTTLTVNNHIPQPVSPGLAILNKSNQVKISEIFVNPPGEDRGQEQIELYNNDTAAVNLQNWYLDDKSDKNVPKASAYRLPDLTVFPKTYISIPIPPDFFVLNNTGGDAVNLFFSDKTLADSVSFLDDAPEGLSLQKINGSWKWAEPTFWQDNNLANVPQTIYINEVMPNPEGPDEGKEWVEIYNPTGSAVNLKGFTLDGQSTSTAPSNLAWTLDGKAIIEPYDYLLLTIPEDKFSLLNSGTQALKFFDNNGKLLEQVTFQNAPEGKSWAKNAQGSWGYGSPTPGALNAGPGEPYKLKISELLPNPTEGQTEFVEILNSDKQPVAVKGLVIAIGDKKKTLNENVTLQPGQMYAVAADELPAQLKNDGQKVGLADNFGRTLDEVAYPKAEAGLSYALSPSGEFVWTNSPTPGQINQIVLGATTEISSMNSVKTASKSKTENVSNSSLAKLIKSNQSLGEQVALLEQKIDNLAAAQANNQQSVEVKPASETSSHSSLQGWYLLLVLAALIVLIYLLKIFVFKKAA